MGNIGNSGKEADFWFACLQLPRTIKHDLLTKCMPEELFVMEERKLKQLTAGSSMEADGQLCFAEKPLLTEKQRHEILYSRDVAEIRERLLDADKKQIRFCLKTDPVFPDSLKAIPDPPAALFYIGDLPDPEASCVSVVGARMCSEFGRRFTMRLAGRIAECGVPVISGMAMGIDSAAHAGALQAGGRTYAVLGGGCDVCYPRSSAGLYRNILENGGILSEYPPGIRPLPYMFPERNRLISGLSGMLIVVEARERSGSLITVDCALEQGRDVYAVPGRVDDALSRGCNRLIDQGAGILYDIDIFLENSGFCTAKGQNSDSSEKIFLEKEEMLVYSCLDLHAKNLQAILDETKLPLNKVLHILRVLTDRQLIREDYRNYYSRADSTPAEGRRK